MAEKKAKKGKKVQLQRIVRDLNKLGINVTFEDIVEYLRRDLKWKPEELPDLPSKKVEPEIADKIYKYFGKEELILQESVKQEKTKKAETDSEQEIEPIKEAPPEDMGVPERETSSEEIELPIVGSLDEIKKKEKEEVEKDVEEPGDKSPELKVVGHVDIDKLTAKKTKEDSEKPLEETVPETDTQTEQEDGLTITKSSEEATQLASSQDAEADLEEATAEQEPTSGDIGIKIVDKVDADKLYVGKPSKKKRQEEAEAKENQEELTKRTTKEKKKQEHRPEKKTVRKKVRIKEEPRRRTVAQQKASKKERRKKKQVEIDQQQVQANVRQILHGQSTKTKKKKKRQREEIQEEGSVLEVTEFITLGELASLMGVPPNELIAKSLQLGKMVTINQRLEKDLIELLAAEYGYEVSFVDVKEQLEEEEEESVESLELIERPPIVVVMGHVDHGKTKLLDYIRRTNVIAGEAGGITQHIGAYQVALDDGRKITFLDTPGHEAFTAMRARGAKVADIAIIVVAADEGVMPQTKEAINHAKAAGLEIVFAINKIDKPNAKPERVKQQLAELGYLLEDWGGEYTSQEISALTGQGVDELLEKVLILAELMELKAPINVKPKGYVIEASKQKGLGNVATVIVREGILKPRMPLVAGAHFAKVRTMIDERGKRVEEAYPGTPVRITGFESLPDAGDKFVVYEDERKAREIAQNRQRLLREQMLHAKARLTLDEASQKAAAGELRELPIILKVDTYGSLEAIRDALLKLNEENDEVFLRIVHADVGQISESDVMLAAASNGVVIGFQVRPNLQARQAAEREAVEIRTYSVIYDLIEDIRSAMEGMRKPREVQVPIGIAEVRETFKIKKIGTVAGCYVKEGKLVRGGKVNVVRNGVVVYTGEIDSLKRHKEDVKEVRAGLECGVHIKGFNDVKKGDVLEAFEIVLVKPGEEVPKGIASATDEV
ncbi:MAG: translation initiation factor IF-2 [Chlorobi bacterium]|nr:translation initiation factor IF-2 [Chlorobiota bacterium]